MKPEPIKVLSTTRVTLYSGDCLDVLDLIPNESIDIIYTDPPYWVPGSSPKGIGGEEHHTVYINKIIERLTKAITKLKGTGVLYLVAQINNHSMTIGLRIQKLFDSGDLRLWHRGCGEYEAVWAFDHQCQDWGWIEEYDIMAGEKWAAFGMEPVELPLRVMDYVEGKTILDPFCGMGSSGLAAMQRNAKHWIGIDIDAEMIPVFGAGLSLEFMEEVIRDGEKEERE